MSLFEGDFEAWNPTDYLKEKVLYSLIEAANLIDLANAKDTTSWYQDKLRNIGGALIRKLLPVAAILYASGDASVDESEFSSIIKTGTLGLAHWCKKYEVEDPRRIGKNAIMTIDPFEEIIKKAENPEVLKPEPTTTDEYKKLELFQNYALTMCHSNLSTAALKILSWAMHHLYYSEYTDVVLISKRFLPTDIGVSVEETSRGYKELYDAGLIERVPKLEENMKDDMALRLISEGINDSKHPVPYEEVEFGFKGARIQGRPSQIVNIDISLSKATQKYLGKFPLGKQKEEQFLATIRGEISEDIAYIESINFADNQGFLFVNARIPICERMEELLFEKLLQDRIQQIWNKWIKNQIVVSEN